MSSPLICRQTNTSLHSGFTATFRKHRSTSRPLTHLQMQLASNLMEMHSGLMDERISLDFVGLSVLIELFIR